MKSPLPSPVQKIRDTSTPGIAWVSSATSTPDLGLEKLGEDGGFGFRTVPAADEGFRRMSPNVRSKPSDRNKLLSATPTDAGSMGATYWSASHPLRSPANVDERLAADDNLRDRCRPESVSVWNSESNPADHAFGKPFGLPELGDMIFPDQRSACPRNPGCLCTAKTAFIVESQGVAI
jgi:hypothetical protein